jgi:hypothetical protein
MQTNNTDHRNHVCVDVMIGYPCPSEASERRKWRSGRLYFTTPVPESLVAQRMLCRDVASRLDQELVRRPLESVAVTQPPQEGRPTSSGIAQPSSTSAPGSWSRTPAGMP